MAEVLDPSSAQTACPKCKKPLTDVAGLGWCPACGYCVSAEKTAVRPEVKNTSQEMPVGAQKQPSFRVPTWPVALVAGVVLYAGATYFATRQNPTITPFARALWCTLQIASGVLMLWVGQFYALLRLAPLDDKFSFKDVLVPFNLYAKVFSRLPELQLSVWLLGWGVTIVVSAIVFVGGLSHWWTYVGKKNEQPRGPNSYLRTG